MAKKVITTVRIDPNIKSWVKSYAEGRGIDISTVINMQLYELRRREHFFEEPYMSNVGYEYYARLAKDVDDGNVKTRTFSSLEAMKQSYSHVVCEKNP